MDVTDTEKWFGTVLSSALECSYYQEILKGLNISKIDDIPLLNKDVLRKSPEKLLNPLFQNKKLVHDFTSGSTGIPIKCYKDTSEYTQLGLILHSARLKHFPKISYSRMIEFTPIDMPICFEEKNGVQRLILSTCFHKPEVLTFYLREIVKFNPTFIQGFPSILTSLAEHAQKVNFSVYLPDLTCLETRAEPLNSRQKQLIEKVFQHPASNHYGSKELYTMAYMCKQDHLHILEDSTYVEVLNSNGGPCVPGEYGEIVVTSKIIHSMPLIRYRIGDYGTINRNPCNCGDKSRTILLIGRSNDSLKTKNGEMNRSVLSLIWELMLPVKQIVQAQLIQVSLEHLHIKYTGESIGNHEVFSSIGKLLRKFLQYDVVITNEYCDYIFPDEKTGKIRNFVPLTLN
ncbi:phenylacetate-CoA ligase [Paenibacillus sp. CF095]|uniref:AMP-binding protein n=1 Tax=unclassified Paenibacillus TaxID=185978 RepID=UPI000883E56E|nr:AMP-binding protein [Paenibacillus sp. CF095]SDD55488.1 phenylacetate-CoA ligase [Paenibacillus sp. CF095]